MIGKPLEIIGKSCENHWIFLENHRKTIGKASGNMRKSLEIDHFNSYLVGGYVCIPLDAHHIPQTKMAFHIYIYTHIVDICIYNNI